jgi:hypothetical protein
MISRKERKKNHSAWEYLTTKDTKRTKMTAVFFYTFVSFVRFVVDLLMIPRLALCPRNIRTE